MCLCVCVAIGVPPSFGDPANGTVIRAVILRDMVPSSYLDPRTGHPMGLGVDVFNAIAAQKGYRVEYTAVDDWGQIDEALQTGKADVCPVLTETEARKTTLHFCPPTETFGLSVCIRANNPEIRDAADLVGRQVGVIRQSQAEMFLADRKDLTLVRFASFQNALFELLAGHIDAYVGPDIVVTKLTRDAGLDESIRILTPPLKGIKRAIAFRRERADLIANVAPLVASFVGSPEYQEIFTRWTGRPQPYWTPMRVGGLVGAVLLLSVGGMAFWHNRSLRAVNRVLHQSLVDLEKSYQRERESEERYREIFNASHEAIVIIDAETQTFDDVNSQFCAMIGRPREDALRLTIGEFSAPGSQYTQDRATAIIRRAIEAGPQVTEWCCRNAEGRLFWVEASITRIAWGGKTKALVVARNITERRQLQERLIQSEKMLSVGGLAAGMAHEINNPLAAMIQTADVITNRLKRDLPANDAAAAEAQVSLPALRRYMEIRGIYTMLQTIHDSGRRAAVIVENMLSFARHPDNAFSGHNVAQILDQTLELARTDYDLKKQYDFRSIEIAREYTDDLPLVPCETSKLQQVFFNILKNGAEAMHGTGTSAVGMPKRPPRFVLRITNDTAARMVQIEIGDNGPGMNEATRRRVFEPFFTTKPVGTGTGLGLSISYFIITETLGGTLTVQSEPGQGTRFTIRLPLERTADQVAGKPNAVSPNHALPQK